MTNRSLRLDRISPRQLLARILDDASLVATVQSLAPRTLGKLIDQLGLEDSGVLVSLATTEQIERIFDDDLWKSERPGEDETFDADRFALWLEVMLEAGEDFVAQKLMELPEDLVTMALHRHILVLDIDALAATEDGDDVERIDKALASCLQEELDRHLVISRRHEGWDSILAVLMAVDKHDHALLDRVLDRCRHMTAEYIDDNGGLFEVLTSEEMLESDVSAEREDRRAAEGFIAPSAAASFLALCRTVEPKDVLARPRDAVTRAWFRDLAPTKHERVDVSHALSAGGTADRTLELERMLASLDEDDAPRARPVFLLGDAGTSKRAPDFTTVLVALYERDPRAHAERMEELAYLSNVLVAGYALDGRTFRPFEAVAAVAAVCNLGLEAMLAETRGKGTIVERAVTLLAREGADKAFRIGWWTLHRDEKRVKPFLERAASRTSK